MENLNEADLWGITLILITLLVWLMLLLLSLIASREKQSQSSASQEGANGEGSAEAERARQRRLREEQLERSRREAKAAKIAQIKEIANFDPLLLQKMLKAAKLNGTELNGDALYERLSRSLSDSWLQVFHTAATQTDLSFNVQKHTQRVEANYPTSDMEPASMRTPDQVVSLLSDQLVLDDNEFDLRYAQDELLVMQSYETQVDQKLLYILVDISSSMRESMRSGVTRHNWSRGVTVNLLLKAVKGEAKYFLRWFDIAPYDLQSALTSNEASVVIDKFLPITLSERGTNIYNAFRQAVEDIRTKGGEISSADILIISDCEDSGEEMKNKELIKSMLGEDIRLHVAMIGNDSTLVKEVATTYHRFN